jgi:quercetin dioxygenase-like cupin family protein
MDDATPFTELADVAPQQIWEGVVARAIHGEQVTLGLIELAPHSRVPEHRHHNEQMGLLVRGSFTLRVGDETREIRPRGTWRILANVSHEVETGPEGALAVEVWSPVREDWSTLERQEPRPPDWP